ncbi:hypothetical protein [Sporosarcina sp. A2]|uniref:hypothetical protein n=1 Tax=Sporosarcina sp. A2 TaxID=3393449 RepID=UPI003D7BFE0E
MEQLKTDAKNFFNYLFQQLKTPSTHFHKTTDSLQNSLLSIVLFILLTAATFHTTLSSKLTALSPTFLQTTLYLSIFFILLVTVNLIALKSTTSLFSLPGSVQELTRKIGGFYVIPITLSAISLLLTLAQSFTLSTILLVVALFIAFILIPLVTITKLLFNETTSIDSFYGILFYMAVTTVAFTLLTTFLADTAIGEILRFIQI